MATATTVLPPMGKISMIGIWVETVLYGVNCVMYGLCMFILLRERKAPTVRWVLVMMCTILFLLSTAHVGASLQQLLDAFIYAPADVPDYSTTYWLDNYTTPRVLKDNLYITMVLAQQLIVIWRFYVVFMYDRRVVIFPVILMAGSVGAGYVSVILNNASVSTPLIILSWAFGLILNVLVTGAIVARLWRMGRIIASLTATSTTPFASSIYLVVESSAITAVAGVGLIALVASNSPASFSGPDVVSQLVVLTPLLIAVQVGYTGRYRYSIPQGDSSRTPPTARDEITFRVGIPRDSCQDLPLHTRPSTSLSSVHCAHV